MSGERNLYPINSSERAREMARKSAEKRHEIHLYKDKVKKGEVGVRDAFLSPITQRLYVDRFLMLFKGVGKRTMYDFMAAAHVAANRRVGGLRERQREQLIDLVERVQERYE